MEITLDQIEYIKGISVISHPDLRPRPSEEYCSKPEHEAYWSILGSTAYLTLTRPDIGVFVSAL